MAQIQLAVRFGPGGFRKLYVIKRLRRDIANESYARMFMHEARLAALLSHPNVVQSHEVNQQIDDCYLKMEYLDGQPLSRLVRRVTRAQLPLEVHLFILTELLAGLQHAHELRDLEGHSLEVVHRDVSPGNLFLTYDGEVKLLDFGISYSILSDEELGNGAIKGKLKYMSPEQAQGGRVDRRSDLYSVGIMLWEAIACAPFVNKDQDQRETLQERRKGSFPPIQEVVPDTSPALVEICEKALALDPDDRFGSAEEFRNALLSFLDAMHMRASREDVAEVMQAQFCDERAQLDSMIRERITSGAHSEDLLALETNPAIQRAQAANEAQLESEPAERRRKMMTYGVGALAMLGSTALVLVFALRSSDKADPMPTPTKERAGAPLQPKADGAAGPSQKTAAEIPSGESQAETVRLAVLTVPGEASIILDGERVGSGAVQLDVRRGEHKHHLLVEHPGYETIERTVILDSDTRIELSLVPIRVDPEQKDSKEKEKSRTSKKSRAKSKRSKPKRRPTSQPSSRKIGSRLERGSRNKKRKIDKESPF